MLFWFLYAMASL